MTSWTCTHQTSLQSHHAQVITYRLCCLISNATVIPSTIRIPEKALKKYTVDEVTMALCLTSLNTDSGMQKKYFSNCRSKYGTHKTILLLYCKFAHLLQLCNPGVHIGERLTCPFELVT